MKYTVEITETFQKQVEIEADNKTEAIDIAKDRYYCEKIWLGENDNKGTVFDVVDVEN